VTAPPYTIEFESGVRKMIAKLPRAVRTRIGVAIAALADNPRPHGAKRLVGLPNLLRIRVGDYRVVYMIEDDRLIVVIVAAGHRSSIYDSLP
jgi:mRNA interferase RelE/StbE